MSISGVLPEEIEKRKHPVCEISGLPVSCIWGVFFGGGELSMERTVKYLKEIERLFR